MVRISDDQTLPVISTLRVDFVPQREMAIRKWYSAASPWYYHRRALPGDFDCSRRFYQLVDPHLRTICRLLHRHGIHTTPSCQGHFHQRGHFEQVWDSLRRDEQLIRADGLAVRDSNDGRQLLFRACTYELPWSTFDDFYSQAALEQTHGYLGMLLPRDRHDVVCELHNRPFHTARAALRFDGQLSCLLGASVFGFAVQPRDPEDCEMLWSRIGEYVQGLLNGRGTHRKVAAARMARPC